MRIIAGEAKGRRLKAPEGRDTRPSSDKLRGALFNILYPRLAGSRVLDLFGGTGALALEALSRGAERAVIVDQSREAVRCIRENALAVLGDGYAARAVILQADYRKALEHLEGPAFDLVFLDPPYAMREAYGEALRRLKAAGLLAEDALAVLEVESGADIALPEGFIAVDQRRYGAGTLILAKEAQA